MPVVFFLAFALGFVVIGQTVALLSRLGAEDMAGTIMVTVIVRELGPLVTALLVLARIGTATVIELGTARALGEVEALEALGIDPIHYLVMPRVLGLAISNGLIAFSGALLAQYQGFADVQMGIGMVVWGLASVIIGRALVGSDSLGLALTGTVMGSVLFRLIIAVALRWGLNPNDLKLVTAVFVFAALVLPT